MKKKLMALVMLVLFSLQVAMAGSILPSSQTAFGTFMPSIAQATGKTAKSDEKTGDERRITYKSFSDSDYESFGTYVNAWGCTAKEYEVSGSSVTISIKKGDAVISFTYDRAKKTAVVVYPKGTRPEESKGAQNSSVSAFPAIRVLFGQQMPSLNGVIGKKADKSTENSDGTLVQKYTDITEAQFDAFIAYAESMECTPTASVDGSKATVEFKKGDAVMTLEYDYTANTAKVTYSSNAWYDDKTATRTDCAGAAITADSLFGVYAPNASRVLKREADSVIESASSSTYVYKNFTDADYNSFGDYMAECGCTVTGYTTEGNSVIIQIEKSAHAFTFIYDRDAHNALVIYQQGTRAEIVVLPTATPSPVVTVKSTVTPTPRPQNYTLQQCHDIAVRYIKNRLKNPSSFQEHGYEYDIDATSGSYTFYFDYSAQNGFGGYNRETYIVKVDYASGTVQYGYSY